MNTLRRKLTGAMIALGIILGFGVVAAPSAQAVTYNRCYYVTGGMNCYLDYSWWEEVWQGHHDGWYFIKGMTRA